MPFQIPLQLNQILRSFSPVSMGRFHSLPMDENSSSHEGETASAKSSSNTEGNIDSGTSVKVTNIKDKITVPQSILTEDISESSSEIEDDASQIRRHGGYTHPLFESDYDPTEPKKEDPYEDVRERMEELARADRDRHFYFAKSKKKHSKNDHAQAPFFTSFTIYLFYAILILVGHIRDFCASLFRRGRYRRSVHFPSDDTSKYAELCKNWENFFTRRIYHRLQDCFNRPIASNPGSFISVLERVSDDGRKTMKVLGNQKSAQEQKSYVVSPKESSLCEEYIQGEHTIEIDNKIARKCLNLGSYNYLGFGDDWNETCAPHVLPTVENLPISCTSSRIEVGNTKSHEDLENLLAEFLGKETVFVHNMGYNTNSTTIPALVGKGDLLISDELNHTSIVNGARASGANIRIFKHNDVSHLEEILKDAIVMGRPRTRRPFNRIMVIVEGIYSMEGEYCNLGPINKVCKKYGVFLYLDEAHSIGAMGPTGRGCCEYWGVDDVDIMMGTFSKSFGGMGGYIAGKKEVINSLRLSCSGSLYHNSMSPIVCQQVITSLKVRC